MTLNQFHSSNGKSFRRSAETNFIVLISGTNYNLTFSVEQTPAGGTSFFNIIALMRIRITVSYSYYSCISSQVELNKIIGIGNFQAFLIHDCYIDYNNILLSRCQSIFMRRKNNLRRSSRGLHHRHKFTPVTIAYGFQFSFPVFYVPIKMTILRHNLFS